MADEKRYQVFVSSTSEDLKGERQRVWETLVSLEYIVSGMEAFPATNDSQFQYIKQQIEQSDYYVLIIAGRYGTLTENGISFTEREFDFAQELKIPSLVFPIRNLASWPVGKTDNDQNKQEKLETFRTRASKNRLCYYWDSADELALERFPLSLKHSLSFGSSWCIHWVRRRQARWRCGSTGDRRNARRPFATEPSAWRRVARSD